MQKYLLRIAFTLCVAGCVAGCVNSWIYRPDKQQGNILTKNKIDQLRPGLSKAQVRYLMGTPVLQSSFDPDRWDYVDYFQSGNKNIPPIEKRVTLFFSFDQLQKISGSTYPAPPGDTKIPLPLIDDNEGR